MPVFSAFFLVALLSSAGLPGLNGFVGEITCFFGIFAANKMFAILSVSTVVLAAAYLLWMFERVMHGPITNEKILSYKDMNKREILYLVPVVVLMFWMGLYPRPFLSKIEPSVARAVGVITSGTKVFVQKPKTVPPQVKIPERSADIR
jgi:NADH-quinone oxidoreductase subunit M